MRLKDDEWTIAHLHQHLQAAVDLEFWTIPYYMSALYSVVDRTAQAVQLVQSVVNQEMLHVQLACNIANAYGLSPRFAAPVYRGHDIPHLDFALDKPDPRPEFAPYSAEIGPLDIPRINGMCLIEYPEWDTGGKAILRDTITEYGSIGEFYDALQYGAGLLRRHIQGGVRQIDHFSAFYNNMPSLTVTDSDGDGYNQVVLLINTIREQGEGASGASAALPAAYQNTADDSDPSWPHFQKFQTIRQTVEKPLTYPVTLAVDYSDHQRALAATLVETFGRFRTALEQLFAGGNPGGFVPLMISVGAGIQNCWKNGVTPRFG
ncbi:ferritin-like domain-containing protein [Nitrospirillum viridazoti]|uniref:Ferritin-like protein n=1 Tax=Nitrospirillum amazonense TaxID=28077 RepID=A0A560I5R1_9PROT|nr:ferritin-like domain-containing protein [Nitrospirillum amazonense]TWB54273.1 ferritin-like protein [Nitrospirillum amazonense]